jgi:hypothetical protein
VTRRAPLALALSLALAACASPPQPKPVVTHATAGLPAKAFPLPPPEPGRKATRSADEIQSATAALNRNIGSYPPEFADDDERDAVYREWSDLVKDARALDWSALGEERRLAALGELYRQGHNLDVVGSAELADELLGKCLEQFPRSDPCNRSLVYFYASVTPSNERLARAEKSLLTLREVRGPAPNEEVERLFVLLRVLGADAPGAQSAIDSYLEKFPNDPHAESLRELSRMLDDGIAVQTHPQP